MVKSFCFTRCGVTANMPALGAGDSGFESLHLDKLCINISTRWTYGDYGVTVNTRVCGSRNSGSIPDSPPQTKKSQKALFCYFVNVYPRPGFVLIIIFPSGPNFFLIFKM